MCPLVPAKSLVEEIACATMRVPFKGAISAVFRSKSCSPMSLSAQEKSEVVEKYQRAPNDVGSPEVQVALLTSRISQMMGHFETHPKDRHSRHGLMKMVHARRSLLKHLQGRNRTRYTELIQSLGLRR